MNYDNPDGKYPPAKLTEPQLKFLRRLSASGKPETVWPGTDTRVANGLKMAGLVSIVSDLATLTDAGRERLTEAYQYDHREQPEGFATGPEWSDATGNRDFIYLAEKLSLTIRQLVVQNPIAHAVYAIAKTENWTPTRFLEELAIAFALAHADLLATTLQPGTSKHEARAHH